MLKLLSFFITIIFSFEVAGFVLNTPYVNGKEVCKSNQSLINNEYSKYVNVPLHHNDPNSITIQIYTYLKKPFNPRWPSLLFFTGGPGVSSRSTEFDMPEINVIFMEQRGISCSRPDLEETFLDPKTYSSEHTARDAYLVMKSYGIDQISIYGHSYGTIPATIFASIFKGNVTSLILESVVFNADDSLWMPHLKRDLLQSLFNNSSLEKQNKILYWSNHNKVPKNWFSKVGDLMLYLDNGISVYETFLDSILDMPEEVFISFIKDFFPNPNRIEEVFSFGDVSFAMIACQEMGMAKNPLLTTYVFSDKNTLIPNPHSDEKRSDCDLLKTSYDEEKTYNAEKYRVSAPVYYLLGEHDGATPLQQGLDHSKIVPLNAKQVFILEKGGHLPLLTHLKEYSFPTRNALNKAAVTLFKKMISAEEMHSSDLEVINQNSELIWRIQ